MRVSLPRSSFRATPCCSAPKYPRPRPGTAERPPYRASDPLLSNPKAIVTKLGEELTFIHRPPATAPTPYSLTTAPTSPLLKPRSDSVDSIELATTQSPSLLLPPSIDPKRTPKEEHVRMSDENLERMQSLRRSDPILYTRGKLAKMFGCSATFVGMVAPLKKSQCKATHKVLQANHDKARDKWSERHSIVMAIRKKRKELW